MSRLKKDTKIVEEVKSTDAPSDYVIQHPLASFRQQKAPQEEDHLKDYTEIKPFEDSEGKLSKLKDKAKLKLLKRKMKKAAKKVHKEINSIAKDEKAISKIRAKFQDKELFDSIVMKKLDEADREIYKESIN